jgi:hypothetical protein
MTLPTLPTLPPPVRIAVIPAVPVVSLRREVVEPAGDWTIADVVEATGLPVDGVSVSLDGNVIEIEAWSSTRPEPGSSVIVGLRPAGISSIAAFLPQPFGAILTQLGGEFGPVASGVNTVAALYERQLAFDLLSRIGPSMRSPEATAPGIRRTVAGSRNAFDPYAPVPQVLGRHRFYPPLAARSYTTVEDGHLYQYALFTFGYGKLALSDLKIGEDPIFKSTTSITYTGIMDADTDAFGPRTTDGEPAVKLELRQGTNTDATITLFAKDVQEQIVGMKLTEARGWITRRTEAGATRITVIVAAPSGLLYRTRSGQIEQTRVDVRIEYRSAMAAAASTWSNGGTATLRGQTESSVHVSRSFDVAEGTYDVRVRRTTADATDPLVVNEVAWASMLVHRAGDPVNVDNLCLVAMKARITGNFAQPIDQFNAVAQTVIPDWDSGTSSWVTRATSNPASIFRHVLQGSANKRAVADSRINLTKLASWHSECDTNGFEFNLVTQGQRTVGDVLRSVASAGRASPSVTDGLFTVVTENALTGAPVQHFTPKNIQSFQEERAFVTQPHALKVQYVDPDSGWLDTERIVPDDGYTTTTATTFRRVDVEGITDSDQAYKLGRYWIASARLRPSQFVIETDFEHLDCVRGDWVKLNHDAILVGLAAGRVTGVTMSGADMTGVTVDQQCPMQAGTYGIRFRKSDGSSVVKTVTTVAGYQTSLTFSTAITSGNPMPAVGDLFLFGTSGSEAIDCVVTEIEPLDELRAQVTLVDAAAAVLTAGDGAIPAYVSGVTIPPVVNPARLTRPRVEQVTSGTVRDSAGHAANVQRGIRIQLGTMGVRVRP